VRDIIDVRQTMQAKNSNSNTTTLRNIIIFYHVLIIITSPIIGISALWRSNEWSKSILIFKLDYMLNFIS
jgi:hypothetical protein